MRTSQTLFRIILQKNILIQYTRTKTVLTHLCLI
nr:MAG TPA: hypothetical protein [Caudoviricetes sp.]